MYKISIFIFFVLLSCSEIIETNKYRELASEQASKKNAQQNAAAKLLKILNTNYKKNKINTFIDKDKLTCFN